MFHVRKIWHVLAIVGLVLQLFSPLVLAAPSTEGATRIEREASHPASGASTTDHPLGANLLPSWLTDPAEAPALSANALPEWLNAPQLASGEPFTPSVGTDLLPDWLIVPKEAQPVRPATIQAAAQCPPESDLSITLTIPPYIVSEGNTVGDTYTVTVSNSGVISATEVSLLVDPNEGFYYVGNSATIASNFDNPSLVDPGTTAPNAPFTLTVAGAPPLNALEPGETMTFTYRLATTDNAPSSQLLSVSLQSGAPTAQACITTQENVPTGRGNLVLTKLPSTQDARVGDSVTWTVTLKNTGLGMVYDAIFSDTFGSALTLTQISPTPTPIDLDIGESFQYTATAVVASCGVLTNKAEASWSIGNEDGTATSINPLQNDADIELILEDPNLNIQVGDLPDVLYCGNFSTPLPITVTNTGGAAQQLTIDISPTDLLVSNPQPASEWTLSGNQLIYTGGAVQGLIGAGETVTLTVDVSANASVCQSGSASLTLTPRAYDACMLLQIQGNTATSTANLGADTPSLVVSKSSYPADIAYSGESIVYTVTLTGDNITNTNGITVTDVFSPVLENVTYTVSSGSAILAGNVITWYPPANTPTINESLLITATIPDQSPSGCYAGQTLINSVQAEASVCPECALQTSASADFIVLDSLAYGTNTFNMESSPLYLCSSDFAAQQFTVTLDVNTGITWTASIYTDTLGANIFDAPYDVVPGSLQIFVDGVDRTSILSYTLGPPLVIDFSGMSAISAYSDTASIQIFYQVEAGAATLGNDVSRSGFVTAYFAVNGPELACDGSETGVLGAYVNLQRGNLDIALAPDTLNSCQENDIVISVTGGNADPDLLTNSLIVTFTAQAGDIVTPTSAVYTGALAGIPVTVTQTGITTTFEFSASAPITGDGNIIFPLYRPCGVSGPLLSSLSYQDLCSASRTAGPITAGETTRSAEVSLYVTPDEYTVYERAASWRWYVSNLGDLEATNAVVTNTLPPGYHLLTYTLSTGYSPSTFLSTITVITSVIGVQEVVTFTIGSLPAGARVRFDVDASISSCTDPAQVDIGLTMPCGQVKDGGTSTCSGVVVDQVIFHRGPTALLSSNFQDANIPLCQSGLIRLQVKNASLLADEFNFIITDTLTYVTYIAGTAFVTVTDSAGAVITGVTSGLPLANILFTPTVTTIPGGELLTWDVASFASGTPQYDVLTQRDGEDLITIEFQVDSDCTSIDAAVQSEASALDICSLPLSTTENSRAVQVDTPQLAVEKIAGNLSAPSGNTAPTFPERIYASVGDSVAFTITVSNDGDAAVTNLFVTDTLPVNISVTTVSPLGNIGTSTVDWGTAGGLTLDVGAMETFIITGTVTNAACTIDGINTAEASYGCSTSDVCLATPVSDTAVVQTQPVLNVSSNTADLLTCGGIMTVTIQNDGPPALDVILTDTLPAPYIYDSMISASTTPTTTPTSGDNPAVWTWTSLPTGQSVLVFKVRTSSTTGVCTSPASPVTNQVDIGYTDSCSTTPPYTNAQSTNLAVETPDIIVSKTPTQQTADVGDTVTWTLTITNVGTAVAPNIQVTDTLSSSYISPSATNGSGGNEATTASIAGNVITWSPPFTLPVGGVWTAQVSAQLQASGQNTNTVEAVGSCGAGCVYDSASAYAHVTLLARFDKGPNIQTKTLGSEVVFTFTAELTDEDTIYDNLTITDTLPVGLGYLSSVVTMTYDLDGSSGGPNTLIWTSPSVSPGVLTPPSSHPSGDVVWNLGNVQGTGLITGVIRTVVQDIATNQQGTQLTNTIDMTYFDDGHLYTYADATNVDLLEPTLAIEKQVFPESVQPGETVYYTLTLYHTPDSYIPAYNVRITDAVPAGVHYIPGTLQLIPSELGSVNDLASPQLTASLDVISATYTAANPVRLRYAATVDTAAELGSAYTNTATLTWTSLITNTFNETRDGSGGIDDYLRTDAAVVSLNNIWVTKRAPISITAGNDIVYTITVYNAGPDPASSAILTDTMPFQVDTTAASYQLSGGGAGACSISADPLGDVVICSLGSISANITATVLITANVPADVPEGADLTNRVHVTSLTPDGDITDNTAQTDTEVYAFADVGVTKSCPATATAGETLTCTLVLTNQGPSIARSVDVKDILPPGLTDLSGSVSQGACASGICQVGDMDVDQTITAVITAAIASDITGVITNTAQVFAVTNDPIPENNSDTANTTILASADLSISKQAIPSPAVPGESLTYEIIVANEGPSDAQNVQLSDILPASFILNSATSSQGSCSALPCILGTIPAGGNATMTLYGSVSSDATFPLTNTATVTSTASDPVSENNTVTVTTELTPKADLALDLTSTPTTYAGTTAIVTTTITNNGPSVASNATVTITLPAGATFHSSTPPTGWTATDNGDGTITLHTANPIADGASIPITMTVNIDDAVAPGASLEFNGILTSATTDPVPDNNTVNTDTSILASAELRVDKRTIADPVAAGGIITYTIIIDNLGPSMARGVQAADSLPSQVTLIDAVSSQGPCAGAICFPGDIAAGERVTMTVRVRVNSSTADGSIITNAIIVTSNTPDPGVYPNYDMVSNEVQALARLILSKKDMVDPVSPGDILIYHLSLTNTGPGDAVNVVVTDTLPAALTYQASTSACVETSPNELTCPLGTVPAGATKDFLVTTLVDTTVISGTTLTNRAFVTTTTPITNSTLSVTETTLIQQALGVPADLQINKTSEPSSVIAGTLVTYTMIITNAGPGAALNVQVVDPLPSGLTPVRIHSSQGLCSDGVCNLGFMPFDGVPSTATIEVVALTDAAIISGTTRLNSAFVQSSQPDPIPNNNVATAAITLTSQADLMVNKTDQQDPAEAGSIVAYTISVTNTGPSRATNVVITDILPLNTTFVSGTGCTESGGAVTCLVGDLDAGASATFFLTLRLNAAMTGAITNVVHVSSDTPDPNLDNNTDIEITALRQVADLSITKSASRNTVIAGQTITYTLTVHNAGPADARDIVLTDTLPAGVTYMHASPAPDAGPNPLIWHLPDLPVGGVHQISVVVDANETITPSALLINQAEVATSAEDPDPANNQDVATVQAFAQADISLSKHASSNVAYLGSSTVFTIAVHNNGPSEALDVDVKDLTPFGMTITQLKSTQGACAGAICQLGDIPVGETALITVTVAIDNNLPEGAVLCNRAYAFLDTSDPESSNNQDQVCVTAQRLSDLIIHKQPSASQVVVGDRIMYSINVTNIGPSPAQGVLVTDYLPANSTYVSNTGGCLLVNAAQLQCNLGSLGVGQSRTFDVIVKVDLDAINPFLNRATVTAQGEPDPTPANNVAIASVTVLRPAIEAFKGVQLWLDADYNGQGSPGDTLRYTIVMTNTGDGAARNVIFNDTPDALTNLVVGSVTTSQGTVTVGNHWSDSAVRVLIGDIPPGGMVTITYDVIIGLVTGPPPVTLLNQGMVNSYNLPGDIPTDDPTTSAVDDPTGFILSITATPIPTPTPSPQPIWLPLILPSPPMCDVARVQTEVWGQLYTFPLKSDGNIKFVPPLPWQRETLFIILGYQGPVTWTQYKPDYHKQEGGYEFIYPGGQSGADFRLFIESTCGTVIIETSVDDPTPTPAPTPNAQSSEFRFQIFMPIIRQ